jgi:hypothetical protein
MTQFVQDRPWAPSTWLDGITDPGRKRQRRAVAHVQLKLFQERPGSQVAKRVGPPVAVALFHAPRHINEVIGRR